MGKKRSKPAQAASISKHPAFPAVVALWFAALLGLGIMVLPVGLLESITATTGIASVVDAAAPPLGGTARFIMAVAGAAIGAGAGLFVAKKIAQAHALKHDQSLSASHGQSGQDESKDPGRMPISAHEELGAACLDEPVAGEPAAPANIGGRRRGLTAADDGGPEPIFEPAPLPGGDASLAEDAAPVKPLELADLAVDALPSEIQADNAAQLSAHKPFSKPDNVGEERRFDAPASALDEGTVPPPFDEREAALDETWDETWDETGDDDSEAPVSPVAGAAHPAAEAFKETREMTDQSASLGEEVYNPLANLVSDKAESDTVLDGEEPVSAAPFAAATGRAGSALNAPIAERPLNELGVAELVERFALALQTAPQAAADPAEEEPDSPMAFRRAGVDSEEAAEAPPPSAFPAALRPVGFDEPEDDGEELTADLSLSFPKRPFEKPAEQAVQEISDDGAAYSSLLSMKNQSDPNTNFALTEDQPADQISADDSLPGPAVIFPGRENQPDSRATNWAWPDGDAPNPAAFDRRAAAATPMASPSDTERALREALEKLQKMSGAA